MSHAIGALLWLLPQGGDEVLPFLPAPNGIRVHSVAIAWAGRAAYAVALPSGYQDDPEGAAGLTAVAANYLAVLARRQLPPQAQARVEVLEDCTLFTVLGGPADTGAMLRWAAVLAGSDAAADADALALARARQALQADDAEHVYPGLVLQSRARRALLRGTPAGHWLCGEPAQLQALGEELVRQRAQDLGSGDVWLAVVGGIDARDWQEADHWPPRRVRAATPPGSAVRSLPADGELLQPLPGAGGPYVACAFRAPPPGPDSLPFALAMAVVQQRAALAFQQVRGRELVELDARAPLCSFDFLAGDRVAVLIRRGANGADMAAPRAEIERLLRQFAERPIEPAELLAAVRRLQTELSLPPYPAATAAALGAAPEGLLARARVLALCGRRHWLLAAQRQLPQVPLAAVRASLSAAVDPASLWWGAVGPETAAHAR